MEANMSGMPGAAFNVTGKGTSSVEGNFTWTPSASDIGEHTLIITSKDSTCSSATGFAIVIKNYSVILIRVLNGLDAGKDMPICKLNPEGKQLFVKGADYLEKITWTDISGGAAQALSNPNIVNPIATPTATTSYVVSTTDLAGSCKNRDTVTVYIDESNSVDIFPQSDPMVLCRPSYLQLDAYIKGDRPTENLQCGPSNQSPDKAINTAAVYGSPVFGFGFAYDTLGISTPVLYNNVKTSKQQFLITKQELREYGINSSTLRNLSFETAKSTTPDVFAYSNFTISLKCTEKTSLSKSAGFETGLVTVYKASGITNFPNGIHKFDFATAYDWDTSKNLIIEICYNNNPDTVAGCTSLTGTPPLYKFMPTTYSSSLSYKPANGLILNSCGVVTDKNIQENTTRPVFTFGYSETNELPFDFKWSGNFMSDSTSKQPLVYTPKSTTYTVATYGKSGCLLRDTLKVYIPVHNFEATPKDTSVCFGESAPIEIRNGTYFEWFEYEDGQYKSAHTSLSCDYCANPIAKPMKSTHYKIKVGDEVFCYDTIDAYVEVRPLPNVHILNRDTVIKYGQSIQLLAGGARVYNWTPVSSLSNPNISYPTATPTESTMYVVSGIGSNGCNTKDTVRVSVNYRDKVFIPTAFSPNGDGKNDVFKASNMSFQRYTEFRVFNRWGQEIFNGGAGDAKTGWDGTWKGVAQETGNYQYLIKIGYPDGLIETYKGDISLIR